MKYRYYCTNCASFRSQEGLLIKPVCQADAAHTVDLSTITVIQGNDSFIGLEKDYRKQRHELIEYVIENFGNLTPDELKVAAEHFAVPLEIRDQFFSREEQISNGRMFHERATHSRQGRYDAVVAELFNRLTYEETSEIIVDLDEAGNLIWKYINLGVEGVSQGDPFGAFDYFESTSGTPFENNGFLQKTFVPLEMTLSELSVRIMDILRNANYEITR